VIQSELIFLLRRHRQAGVVIDTNLFLLLAVGAVDCNLLSESSKTHQFDREDYLLLARFCSVFTRHVITPPIVTEACNLLDTLNRGNENKIFLALRGMLAMMKESHRSSAHLAGSPVFSSLGLADASIFALAERNLLVVTDDLELHGHISTRGFGSLNFNHLRTWNWR